MSISEMFVSGVELMLLGMGMVFMFLALLILVMQAMSAFAARFIEQPASGALEESLPVGDGGLSDPRLIAVISAAIARYRTQRPS